jgi:hypothetical protein
LRGKTSGLFHRRNRARSLLAEWRRVPAPGPRHSEPEMGTAGVTCTPTLTSARPRSCLKSSGSCWSSYGRRCRPKRTDLKTGASSKKSKTTSCSCPVGTRFFVLHREELLASPLKTGASLPAGQKRIIYGGRAAPPEMNSGEAHRLLASQRSGKEARAQNGHDSHSPGCEPWVGRKTPPALQGRQPAS